MRPSDPGTPQLQLQDACATITLMRPDHHNRLHVEDLLTLQQHLDTVRALPEARVLLLTATGKSFCSGFHLGSLAQRTSNDAAASPPLAGEQAGPQLFEQTVDALEALPLPTVCALNGGVYGGAIDLALACDFRLGVDTLQARMPAVRLGLHYYPSGLQRYVSRLGLQNAKRLFMLAETLSAPDLLALGVVDALVPAARLATQAAQLVAQLAAGAPLAMHGMKASLNEIARGEFHLARLQDRVARCAASADLKEGLAALAEQRAPRFTGQ